MLPNPKQTMLVLPRGITGFWFYKESPPPRTNERDFRAYCYTAAQQLRGSVVAYESVTEHYARNFSLTTIQLPHDTISVLLNGQFPFIAMAHPIENNEMNINFLDAPTLSDEFRKFDCYNILSASELVQRITDITISELSAGEMTQVKYWEPTTIGELVFNFWD